MQFKNIAKRMLDNSRVSYNSRLCSEVKFKKLIRQVDDSGMSNLVFGVGIGLFVILILWFLALVVFIIFLRLEKKIGTFAILIVSVCTVILFALPRASDKPNNIDKKTYDNLFIWRILLLTLLIISCITGLLAYIKFALITPIRPIRISTWIL